MKFLKENLIKIIICVVIILLIIPIGIYRLKDGGSTVYKGLIYNITKVHALNEQSSSGYEDGWIIKLFGIQIYNKVNFNKKSTNIGELEKPVTLTIKSGTLTEKGATIVISNGSKITYTYGPEYFIEKKENGIWNEIKLEEPLSWNTVIYTLKPNEKQEFNIDFTMTYGILSKGQYRVGKSLSVESNSTNREKITIYAEFEIK